MTEVYIGIGSNLGDKPHNCLRAIEKINQIPGSKLARLSDLYLTKPVGVKGQDWYMNGVASITASMSAEKLLNHLITIEEDMGRIRKEHWAARIIDLDILLYGHEIIHKENLKVPHPLMHLRRFVLVPMVQLASDLIHPSFGLTMAELLRKLPEDGQTVIPLKE